MSDCHEAEAKAQDTAGQSRGSIGKTEHIAYDEDGRADQRCNGR